MIFENGFNDLVIQNDFVNLKRIFRFLTRIDKVDFIKKNFNNVIKIHGT
jgi:hypothetical protein